jgi:signal transduction histidine kinase
VIDDHVDTLTAVRLLLEREGHKVLTAQDGAAALALLAREPVQLLLVDYFMPVMNGEELIRQVRERDPLVQIVLHTGYAGEKPPREMLTRLAIQGYHDKSEGPRRLLLWVDTALKAYDQLAQLHIAERLKTELLANVSHEFRTPLNVILGYMELLRDGTFGACPPEVLPVFDKVLANAAYLLELSEEFLDLSRIEAGSIAVRRDVVPVVPMLRELAESFALLVRGRPVTFRAEIPDELPVVAGDGAKLRVVFQNLLANALKFTKEGEIRLTARTHDNGTTLVTVSDTGPGIAPEHHEAIFEIFRQLSPCEGQSKGVGLGLALARRFARMMDGEITVQSQVGVGTIFAVTLPRFGGVAAETPAACAPLP